MKIVMNPDYESLRGFMEKLPAGGCDKLHVYCNHRNEVFLTVAGDMQVVVKRYKRPTWINMAVYAYFRPSKPKRAYEYAFRLREAGFDTPEPVGYIEIRKGGLFHTGYFVSRFLDYRQLTELNTLDPERRDGVVEAFARFTCRLHESGFFPHDYATANVMYSGDKAGGFRFALVDINSMSFGRWSRKKCVSGLKVLDMKPLIRYSIVSRYAELRGWNGDECFARLVLHRARVERAWRLKRRVKRALGIGRPRS